MNNQIVPDVGAAHAASVHRLLASYREIPVGAPVRLAKRTSNLFRPRTGVAGLDRATFDSLYNGPGLDAVKRRYDPDNRLTTLYDKAVRRQ